MATDVIVSGFDGIEGWATEKTLSSILSELSSFKNLSQSSINGLKDSIDNAGSNGGNLSNTVAKQIIDALKKSTSQTQNSNNIQTLPNINSNSSLSNINALSKALKEEGKDRSLTGALIASSSKLAWQGLSLVGKAAGMTLPVFKSIGQLSFDLLTGAVIGTATVLMKQGDMYRDLYKSGVLFKTASNTGISSMGKFAQAAFDMRVPFQDLSNIMKNYSKVVNREGLQGFSNMAVKFRDAGSTFGLTASESAEYLAEYMEQQRNLGQLQALTQPQIIAGAQLQLKNTMDFARALGLSTKELEDSRKSMVKDTEFQTALQSLPEEIKKRSGPAVEKMIAGMNSISTPLANMMVKFIQDPTLALGDSLTQSALAMGSGGRDAVEALQRFGNLSRSGLINESNMASEQKRMISAFAAMGKDIEGTPMATALELAGINVKQFVTEINKAKEAQANATKNRITYDDKSIEAITSVSSAMSFFGDIINQFVGGLWQNDAFVKQITIGLHKLSKILLDEGLMESLRIIILKVVDVAVTYMPKLIDSVIEVTKFLVSFTSMSREVEENTRSSFNEIGATVAAFGAGILLIPKLLRTVFIDGLKSGGILRAFGSETMSMVKAGTKSFADGFKLLGLNIGDNFKGIFKMTFGSLRVVAAPFLKFLGPLASIFSGFIGALQGIREFNVQNIGGSIANIFLRLSQGVANGFLDTANLFVAGLEYVSKWIMNGFSGEGLDFSEMLNNSFLKADVQGYLDGKFNKSSTILTGNKQIAKEQVKVTQEKAKETKTEKTEEKTTTTETKQSTEKEQKEVVVKTEYYEKSISINNDVLSVLQELLKQMKNSDANQEDMIGELKRLNTRIGNVYNNGAA